MAPDGILPHLDVGSGSPVILLHGFGLDHRMWSAQVEALRHHHRVIVPDLPGFGPLGAETGLFDPAADVLHLISQKGLGPVHLVGFSFGGAAAVDLVLSHPEAVQSLVLIDALLLGERTGIESWKTCVEKAQQDDLPAAREAWLQSSLFQRALSVLETAAAVRAMVACYPCGHWRGAVETAWQRPEPLALLPTIACPTLVLVGEMDLPTFHAMARTYVSRIAGARFEQFKGVGHLGPMEAPEQVSNLLLQFFAARGAQ